MYNKTTLPNGLTLLTAPKSGTQAVTVLVMLPVGSRYESANLNGVSHFIEHMMFKGTDRRPTSLDLTKELDSVGAEFNAFTAKDHTGYYVKIAADKVELAFDILSDMLFHSKIDAAELEKERGVIIEEINMYEDNPLLYIESLFEQAVFAPHPLGWQIAGSASVIKKISRNAMLNYYQSHYNLSNLFLTVAGNFDEKKIKSLTAKYFNSPAGKNKKNKYSVFILKQSKPNLTLRYKNTNQVQLCLGFPAFNYEHKDIDALHLLEVILGGNMSSRLFTEIREHHGLAYFIKASTNIYQDTGSFVIHAGLDKNRLFQAIKIILSELKKIKNSGVTAAELKDAKQYLAGKLTLDIEDSENVAAWYSRQALLTKKILTPAARLEKIKKMNISGLNRVARKIFKTAKLNLALIGPFRDKSQFKKLFKNL